MIKKKHEIYKSNSKEAPGSPGVIRTSLKLKHFKIMA